MKTISEMATDYMNDNRLAIYDEDTGEVEMVASLNIRLAYKQGANAVLVEIEKCMSNKDETITDWIILIRSKIRELKGE